MTRRHRRSFGPARSHAQFRRLLDDVAQSKRLLADLNQNQGTSGTDSSASSPANNVNPNTPASSSGAGFNGSPSSSSSGSSSSSSGKSSGSSSDSQSDFPSNNNGGNGGTTDTSNTSGGANSGNANNGNTNSGTTTSGTNGGTGNGQGQSGNQSNANGQNAPTTPKAPETAPSPTSTAAPTTTSTQAPTSTAAPKSTTTAAASTTTAAPNASSPATTTSSGSVVYVTSTGPPTAQATGGTLAGQGEQSSDGSGANIGAIIGGIAGGIVGVILLVWLILLPVRARAKKQREVDWLTFKPDSHHDDQDGSNSIFRTPRAGLEDDDVLSATTHNNMGGKGAGSLSGFASPESYQMHEVTQGGNGMGTLYGHLDQGGGNGGQPWQQQQGVGASQHDPQYAAYYAQQQGSLAANYTPYSPQTSPVVGPMLHRGTGGGSLQGQVNNAYTQNAQPAYVHGGGQPLSPPEYGYAYGDGGPQQQQQQQHQQQQTLDGQYGGDGPQLQHSRSFQGAQRGDGLGGGYGSGDLASDAAAAAAYGIARSGSTPAYDDGRAVKQSGTSQGGMPLDTSIEGTLPYDRDGQQSPIEGRPAGNANHLHLANPDDD